MTLKELLPQRSGFRYNFAFINEGVKKEVRRALLKAVALPGHQVPFASPELPIARGWGTGGLQVTMSIIGPNDVLKIIDQGCDGSVNAVNLRKLLVATTGVRTTFDSREATVLQSRHRLPEIPLRADQIAVLQVPLPEPLRLVEPSEVETRRMHSEGDYARMWVSLYEDVVQNGSISLAAGYPVRVNNSYIMSPSPLPRWDLPLLNGSEHLTLLGAGREKRVYAVPPHTSVQPLEFDDMPFTVENFSGMTCARCGSSGTFLDEIYDEKTGRASRVCSDSGFCDLVREGVIPRRGRRAHG
ncbi:MAG TPA: alpha-D-ribose 1-methylphosphonate 5-phosphate C-P-lyase PhnJ [Spirochaetia bacterium]|nr:alpha-D-ribose 1-methylphosphonate 5-phosphate C-P-lyase PhnJ [Spirochaetia bacterium]